MNHNLNQNLTSLGLSEEDEYFLDFDGGVSQKTHQQTRAIPSFTQQVTVYPTRRSTCPCEQPMVTFSTSTPRDQNIMSPEDHSARKALKPHTCIPPQATSKIAPVTCELQNEHFTPDVNEAVTQDLNRIGSLKVHNRDLWTLNKPMSYPSPAMKLMDEVCARLKEAHVMQKKQTMSLYTLQY
ncbi:unnamed protein product [Clavelina lepadiformis]|uniref:Uncharacterized protein n=1 Tax=Clavelina lepadiformis TaxID=159417 RepID=A0ABP0FP88_CLALP